MTILADSVKRITKDDAIAALTEQAFRCQPDEDDYRRAVRLVGALCRCESGQDRLVPSSEILAAISSALAGQRVIVHCYLGSFGADWDLDKAVALVREANEVGWCRPWMGHGLVVLSGGRTYKFQCVKPDSTGEAGR